MKKNILTLVICLLCSLIATFGLQYIFADNNSMSLNNSSSLLSQEIVNNTRNEKTYYKLYYRGQLLGIVNNLDDFYSYIDSYYVMQMNIRVLRLVLCRMFFLWRRHLL